MQLRIFIPNTYIKLQSFSKIILPHFWRRFRGTAETEWKSMTYRDFPVTPEATIEAKINSGNS